MNTNQIARFWIDEQMVRDNPDRIADVFAMLKFVPVRVECLFARREIEYVGLSERFSEVAEGFVYPDVQLKITIGKNGEVESVEVAPYTGVEAR